MSLPAPKQISPLIRFGRWTALISGVIYGASRLRSLTAKEVDIQKHENEIRARRDARLKRERERDSLVEMQALAKEAGVPQN
ncbi:hypothetical protein SNE40_017613 [Patella caerulea]|uniref:ATP synthase F(0) complex subunit e, mitochondrial n=1 Tax=Patella caerulea TaxID=87958 RepID=A0AAN8JFD6_PATCE